ncbi:hypothetical protein CTAYLR_004578 [Chrysophaeum taylorii]|uniref:SDR family NAD(P)-dependent oxidoreductase n=1 Tax=Chrysophaeum taylorii TaxID=2483200 RepID=A0AAD7UFP7_9STRA|nr:hypothetical protein CTAYLR_004578 [Chrysophaeum taylorii]
MFRRLRWIFFGLCDELAHNLLPSQQICDVPPKRVLVTGGTSGIGEATCRRLGANAIVGGRNMTRAREIASEIGASCVRVDLSSPAAAVASARRARAFHPDVLVNNAAVMGKSRSETMRVNVVATAAFTRALGAPVVVNVGSSSHLRAQRFTDPKLLADDTKDDLRAYAASKLCLMHYSQLLREEGVCVRDCHPGIVWTPMLKEYLRYPNLVEATGLRRLLFKHPAAAATSLLTAAFLPNNLTGYVVHNRLQPPTSLRISPAVHDPKAIAWTKENILKEIYTT